jgi:Domain of unknown function (DUF4262)
VSADLSDFERKILDNVRNHGCHINYVADPEGEQPSFGYSVGFPETVGQPEVIVFGLSGELLQGMINALYRQCRDGLKLEDGLFVSGLLEGHECVLERVATHNIVPDYFNSAMWFRHYTTGEAMDAAYQIIWPGAQDGLFPWDEGASDQVRLLQPPLSSENFKA